MDVVQQGFGGGVLGLTLLRVVLGLFFAISGYHKLFNRQRHASLVATLQSCHVPFIRFNQWWVPLVEFFGGLALLSGILAPLAAAGLIVECSIAVCTDGRKRVSGYQPIDRADWLDDLLYLPEMLYVVGLLVIITAGPGPFTIPALF
jgi:uncharacterized membrane protein YphA (DoxX/SURF4 family)